MPHCLHPAIADDSQALQNRRELGRDRPLTRRTKLSAGPVQKRQVLVELHAWQGCSCQKHCEFVTNVVSVVQERGLSCRTRRGRVSRSESQSRVLRPKRKVLVLLALTDVAVSDCDFRPAKRMSGTRSTRFRTPSVHGQAVKRIATGRTPALILAVENSRAVVDVVVGGRGLVAVDRGVHESRTLRRPWRRSCR